eukprot:303576-Chlamydomonas_euryale.AAC.1
MSKGSAATYVCHIVSVRRSCSKCPTTWLDTANIDQLPAGIQALFPYKKTERSGLDRLDIDNMLLSVSAGVPVSQMCNVHNGAVSLAHARRVHGFLEQQVKEREAKGKLRLQSAASSSTPALIHPPLHGRESILQKRYVIEQFMEHSAPLVDQHKQLIDSRAHWIASIDANFKVDGKGMVTILGGDGLVLGTWLGTSSYHDLAGAMTAVGRRCRALGKPVTLVYVDNPFNVYN